MSHSRWNLFPSISDDFNGSPGISRLVIQLLNNRGITGSSEVESFLKADESLTGDPNLLPGIHEAVARLYRALLSKEKIAVYGDFDVDGITATALLVQGLSILDCTAIPYIPNRDLLLHMCLPRLWEYQSNVDSVQLKIAVDLTAPSLYNSLNGEVTYCP